MSDSALNLDGMRIVLTGVSRGVGLCTARILLGKGARILGVARNAERLSAATEELKTLGDFESICADLEDPQAAAKVAEKAAAHFGEVDLLINNAAIMPPTEGSIFEEDAGVFELTVEGNLNAPYRMSRAFLPLLKKGKNPRIINVGSGAGTLDGLKEDHIPPYRVSKWAILGLTMLAAHQHKDELSVVAFDPGWVCTDLGGPNAPGTPEESAIGLMKTALLPIEVTGKFYKDGEEIPF